MVVDQCCEDFAAIFMICGFCGGKEHVEDLGTGFHTVEISPRFRPPVLGVTPYSCLDVFS